MDGLERLEASRGKFLAAAGITGAALATGAWKSHAAGAAAADRSYAAGYFVLELEGVAAGALRSVEGGAIRAEVVEEAGSATYFRKKHVGGVAFDPFEIQAGLDAAKPLREWIQASLRGEYMRKSGAIRAADFRRQERSVREFTDALVTAIGFPALDASSKEPGSLTVAFAPDLTRRKPGSGQQLAFPASPKQQLWLPSSFRLELPGLPTQRVTKIDAFSVELRTADDAAGELRDHELEPGKLEFPNLTVTFAAADAPPWEAWHDDFVIAGNNDESKEKSGALVFLSPNRQSELARLDLRGVGIVSVERLAAESARDAVERTRAELYCERFELRFPDDDEEDGEGK